MCQVVHACPRKWFTERLFPALNQTFIYDISHLLATGFISRTMHWRSSSKDPETDCHRPVGGRVNILKPVKFEATQSIWCYLLLLCSMARCLLSVVFHMSYHCPRVGKAKRGHTHLDTLSKQDLAIQTHTCTQTWILQRISPFDLWTDPSLLDSHPGF